VFVTKALLQMPQMYVFSPLIRVVLSAAHVPAKSVCCITNGDQRVLVFTNHQTNMQLSAGSFNGSKSLQQKLNQLPESELLEFHCMGSAREMITKVELVLAHRFTVY
jgi:hypothetical protein